MAALADLVKWLDDTKMPSMIIGRVAASILGQPRLTQDVDALAILPKADWANAVFSVARHGNPSSGGERARFRSRKTSLAGETRGIWDRH